MFRVSFMVFNTTWRETTTTHSLLFGGVFSDTAVSSTNKTYRYYITEILLKVALNTITLTLLPYKMFKQIHYRK
jgi:hypothetical protein